MMCHTLGKIVDCKQTWACIGCSWSYCLIVRPQPLVVIVWMIIICLLSDHLTLSLLVNSLLSHSVFLSFYLSMYLCIYSLLCMCRLLSVQCSISSSLLFFLYVCLTSLLFSCFSFTFRSYWRLPFVFPFSSFFCVFNCMFFFSVFILFLTFILFLFLFPISCFFFFFESVHTFYLYLSFYLLTSLDWLTTLSLMKYGKHSKCIITTTWPCIQAKLYYTCDWLLLVRNPSEDKFTNRKANLKMWRDNNTKKNIYSSTSNASTN